MDDWFSLLEVDPPPGPGMHAHVRGTVEGVCYDGAAVGYVDRDDVTGRWTPDEPGDPAARWYDTVSEAAAVAAREYLAVNTRQLLRNLGGHAAWRAGRGLPAGDLPAWQTDAVVGRLTGEWVRGYPDALPALCDRMEELGFPRMAAILREPL